MTVDPGRPPFLDGATISRVLPTAAVIDTIREAVAGGFDPETEPLRTSVALPAGQILFMPSAIDRYAGVKLVSVAPANSDRGLPRIQGVYLLMDAATLAPVALLDAPTLTAIRTPAVSAVAVDHLAAPDARRLLVFGTGPQAHGHVEAIRQVRPIERLSVVGRRPASVEAFVARWRALGLHAEAAGADPVGQADIICCCTTARHPLFDGSLVGPSATVVAVGSHEPDVREVDENLVARAVTVVETRSTALREAGEIVHALRAGRCTPDGLHTLAELVRGAVTVPPTRPRLFKSTGMAWQDLVTAAAVHRRWLGTHAQEPSVERSA
ncbi:ornithine cyclodeaminase family protein [Micromonospora sp. NBS 11-29]|uniref:ornithine cyclodeaminase family protein n=1 Tax=Micromonospora sp. NBS 11-29 TaxID=1960879 RepID=UPI000B775B48|nr:ornithine cyclodeaminase family protein [Micromonospora sp. NBS 11-29]